MHPQAPTGCHGDIIRSHTVQRSRILERLIDSTNHVRTFHPLDMREEHHLRVGARAYPRLHRVGWKRASTFHGFCAGHDVAVFRPIEVVDFAASPEQMFLVGYRAACHELYQKDASLQSSAWALEHLDRGLPDGAQRHLQMFLSSQRAQLLAGREDILAAKTQYDVALLSQDLSDFSAVVVWFDGDLSLATTGMFTPDTTLDGRPTQNLLDFSAAAQLLSIGSVATPTGGGVVFVWERTHRAITRFIDSLLAFPERRLPSVLAEVIFVHIENVYFSDEWWRHRTVEQAARIEDLAGTHLDAGRGFMPEAYRHLPWRVTGIQRCESL